ncbi:MAG: twin-arginine translocase TatA/TatE family subunit [Acidobacteria bacterium]|nr:MAG: twin-arginine translocase TatA/TatE family subunit [Acidobacteriota bacterium]TDI43872.1 MAG: twin-arginine translocase TatA/TatE family subunit [Acidobacteriota bacterium]
MFGLGVQELLIILAILLLIFGPKRLPQLGNALGRTIKGFRKGVQESDEKESSEDPQIPKSSP